MSIIVESAPRHALRADARSRERATTLISTLVPVVVGLLIGLTFVAVFLGAFHDPAPRHLAVAVVAPQPIVAAVEASSAGHGDAFAVMSSASADDAGSAVRSRDVLGAFIIGPTGSTTAALLKTFGPAGTFIAAVALLVFGNATSTGILPGQYLPDGLEPLTSMLPVGVAVRALRGAAYLDNDGVAAGLGVMILWVVGAVLLYGAGQLIQQHRAGRSMADANREAVR